MKRIVYLSLSFSLLLALFLSFLVFTGRDEVSGDKFALQLIDKIKSECSNKWEISSNDYKSCLRSGLGIKLKSLDQVLSLSEYMSLNSNSVSMFCHDISHKLGEENFLFFKNGVSLKSDCGDGLFHGVTQKAVRNAELEIAQNMVSKNCTLDSGEFDANCAHSLGHILYEEFESGETFLGACRESLIASDSTYPFALLNCIDGYLMKVSKEIWFKGFSETQDGLDISGDVYLDYLKNCDELKGELRIVCRGVVSRYFFPKFLSGGADKFVNIFKDECSEVYDEVIGGVCYRLAGQVLFIDSFYSSRLSSVPLDRYCEPKYYVVCLDAFFERDFDTGHDSNSQETYLDLVERTCNKFKSLREKCLEQGRRRVN